jgi:hypothetical protein
MVWNLPVAATAAMSSAAGESATCVASTSEPAAHVTAAVSTTYTASGISATCVSTRCAAIGVNATTINSASAVAVSTAIAVAATVSIAATEPIAAAEPIAPVIPRASADKEAADEPARTVIAIGSAGVRCIRIVAPIANRGTVGIRRVDNRRTDANPHPDLSICRRGESQGQSQEHCHQNQSKTFHETLPVPPCPIVRDPELGVYSASQHPPGWVCGAQSASVHWNNKRADKLR